MTSSFRKYEWQAQFRKSEYATFVHSESPLYTQDFMAILKGLLFQVAGEGAGVHEEKMDEMRTLPLGPQPTSSSLLDQLQLEPFLVAKFPFVKSSLGPGHPPVSHLHAPVFSVAF